jgi:hypothetical protein
VTILCGIFVLLRGVAYVSRTSRNEVQWWDVRWNVVKSQDDGEPKLLKSSWNVKMKKVRTCTPV